MSSCRCPIPLWLQGFPCCLWARYQGGQKCPSVPHCPSPCDGWGRGQLRVKVGTEAWSSRYNWLPTWQMLVSYAKEGEKEKPPWGPSAPGAGTACGHGAGEPGPPRAPAGVVGVWISKQGTESSWGPQACICGLILSRDQSHRAGEGFNTSTSFLLFYTWGDEDPEGWHAAGHMPVSVRAIGKVLVAQLCETLGDPVVSNPPGSSVHGILQARILKWVAIPFSRGSIFLTQGSNSGLLHCGQIFTVWISRKVKWKWK